MQAINRYNKSLLWYNITFVWIMLCSYFFAESRRIQPLLKTSCRRRVLSIIFQIFPICVSLSHDPSRTRGPCVVVSSSFVWGRHNTENKNSGQQSAPIPKSLLLILLRTLFAYTSIHDSIALIETVCTVYSLHSCPLWEPLWLLVFWLLHSRWLALPVCHFVMCYQHNS